MRYILNPDKTEDLLYTASVNCMTDAESAYLQMGLVYDQFAKDHFNGPPPLQGKGSVKAIHYIQSFAPDDNVTPELAHKIAKAFLRKAFGDDVQAVIATHVDKDHLHSHIIINSYSLSGKKYYANRKSLEMIRRISNGVCKAFGIDIHPNLTGKGKSINYKEWEHRKNGTSWKEQIRQEIDKLIPSVNSLDELLQMLEEHGYEVKRGTYISIKAPGQERFVRTKTLGDEYTEDNLNIRITYRDMGTGITPTEDKQTKLCQAYSTVLHDVRILAAQRKKVPRKRIVTAAYSVENDLDVYKLSVQLSVISKDNIKSIGELQGRIAKLRADYEKQRGEINNYIDEHNRLVSLWEQAQLFDTLSAKDKLSDSEQFQINICRQAMENNNIHNRVDYDLLKSQTYSLQAKINALKGTLEKNRQRYDVYCDISKTYSEISKSDYISNLIEEQCKRLEKVKKKKQHR